MSGLDRRAEQPWTHELLTIIAQHPAAASRDLAHQLGCVPVDQLKRRVRRLEELGLTISLGTGYTLSPRGHRYHEWSTAQHGPTAPARSPRKP